MKRRQFAGLMQKEWVQYKWGALSFVAANIAISIFSFAPLFNSMYTEDGIADMLSFWFIVHIAAGALFLTTSMRVDMKQPELTLHSPVSMRGLLTVKVVFATAVLSVSLFLCACFAKFVHLSASIVSNVPLSKQVLLSFSIFLMIVLSAVFIMSAVLLLYALYEAIHSVLRFSLLSVAATAALVFAAIIPWSFLYFSDWFGTVREWLPLFGEGTGYSELLVGDARNLLLTALIPESALLTGGSLLLFVFFIFIVNQLSAWLLEKKVRY